MMLHSESDLGYDGHLNLDYQAYIPYQAYGA